MMSVYLKRLEGFRLRTFEAFRNKGSMPVNTSTASHVLTGTLAITSTHVEDAREAQTSGDELGSKII